MADRQRRTCPECRRAPVPASQTSPGAWTAGQYQEPVPSADRAYSLLACPCPSWRLAWPCRRAAPPERVLSVSYPAVAESLPDSPTTLADPLRLAPSGTACAHLPVDRGCLATSRH